MHHSKNWLQKKVQKYGDGPFHGRKLGILHGRIMLLRVYPGVPVQKMCVTYVSRLRGMAQMHFQIKWKIKVII